MTRLVIASALAVLATLAVVGGLVALDRATLHWYADDDSKNGGGVASQAPTPAPSACDVLLEQLRAANTEYLERQLYERANDAHCLPTPIPPPPQPPPSCARLEAEEAKLLAEIENIKARRLTPEQQRARDAVGIRGQPSEDYWLQALELHEFDINFTHLLMQQQGC